MKKLVLLSLSFLTTLSLITSCGEKTATENATVNATTEAVIDSTENATTNTVDTTTVK
jgi:ABC-type phosphate/phosphonate transport system substrate-binding protein